MRARPGDPSPAATATCASPPTCRRCSSSGWTSRSTTAMSRPRKRSAGPATTSTTRRRRSSSTSRARRAPAATATARRRRRTVPLSSWWRTSRASAATASPLRRSSSRTTPPVRSSATTVTISRAQLAIERIENPPRLDARPGGFPAAERRGSGPRGQPAPDRALLPRRSRGGRDSCRICHHQTLESCSECHTLQGTEESEGVNLFRAMHAKRTDHSCVGCHDTEKATPECAGCHDQMEQARLPEEGCELCHQGPLPEMLESERSRYRSLDDFRPLPVRGGAQLRARRHPGDRRDRRSSRMNSSRQRCRTGRSWRS